MNNINTEKIEELLSSFFKWRRPTCVPFPNIWHKFTAKSKCGKTCNIKIVDLTPERFEEVDEIMMKYFYANESMSQSLKILKDDVTIKNLRSLRKAISAQCFSLIAVLDEDVPEPEIVGVQNLMVITRGDELSEELEKLYQPFSAFSVLWNTKLNRNVFEIYGVDAIIRGVGLCVKPEYAGLSIAYNLTLPVEKLARACGIKVYLATYSNIRTQKMAEKVGFKLLKEIAYEDVKDEHGRVIFPGLEKETLKFGVYEYLIANFTK